MKNPITIAILSVCALPVALGCAKPEVPAPSDDGSVIQMEDFEGDVQMEFSEPTPLPDPNEVEAEAITDFITEWVNGQAEDGVYDIPKRSGHEVAGSLGGYHTVHRAAENTYTVCADFVEGDHIYDVDFEIMSTDEGYSVNNHYLHKIDGEAVE